MDSFPWKWQFCVKFHEILHFLLFTTPGEGSVILWWPYMSVYRSASIPVSPELYMLALHQVFWRRCDMYIHVYTEQHRIGSGVYDCLVIYTFCYRLYYSAFKFNSSVTSDKNGSRYAQLPLGDRWLTSHWRAADRGQNLASWLGRLTLIIPRKTDSVRWLIDWL